MAILDLWGQWIWFAGAALGLATALVSVVYVLSEMLMNDKMKIWAKMELTEIFYSAIIISMAIGGLPIIDSVVHGALVSGGAPIGPAGPLSAWVPVQGPGGIQYQALDICGDQIAAPTTSVYHGVDSCHMRLSIWYLREVFDEAKAFAFDIYLSYILTSMIAEFTINIEFLFEKAGFFTFNPWRGFFTMGNTIKALVFDWAIKIMMITKFQEIMLRFITTALFPALFVIGAILRTFSFTRRLGGLLLAMALALYFIYPAFYAFGALVMLGIKNDPLVVSAWLSPDNPQNPGNRDADPSSGPTDYPDPQIANTMYMVGDYAMIGGNGSFSSGEAVERLRYYEGASSDDYFRWMEEREQNATIHFDLTDDTTHTDQEYNDSYRAAYDKGQQWFNNVSQQGKFDNFITFAWGENGPIETLSRLTFWSLFFALFSIIGTIAGIRSLSITFGGDIEIAGLTRLI
jgi:hypothetical protein